MQRELPSFENEVQNEKEKREEAKKVFIEGYKAIAHTYNDDLIKRFLGSYFTYSKNWQTPDLEFINSFFKGKENFMLPSYSECKQIILNNNDELEQREKLLKQPAERKEIATSAVTAQYISYPTKRQSEQFTLEISAVQLQPVSKESEQIKKLLSSFEIPHELPQFTDYKIEFSPSAFRLNLPIKNTEKILTPDTIVELPKPKDPEYPLLVTPEHSFGEPRVNPLRKNIRKRLFSAEPQHSDGEHFDFKAIHDLSLLNHKKMSVERLSAYIEELRAAVKSCKENLGEIENQLKRNKRKKHHLLSTRISDEQRLRWTAGWLCNIIEKYNNKFFPQVVNTDFKKTNSSSCMQADFFDQGWKDIFAKNKSSEKTNCYNWELLKNGDCKQLNTFIDGLIQKLSGCTQATYNSFLIEGQVKKVADLLLEARTALTALNLAQGWRACMGGISSKSGEEEKSITHLKKLCAFADHFHALEANPKLIVKPLSQGPGFFSPTSVTVLSPRSSFNPRSVFPHHKKVSSTPPRLSNVKQTLLYPQLQTKTSELPVKSVSTDKILCGNPK